MGENKDLKYICIEWSMNVGWIDRKGIEQLIVICATARQMKMLPKGKSWEADVTLLFKGINIY